MITLNTKTGEFKFNLKTGFPREIELCQTITRLQSKNSTASINIMTSYDENLSIKIPDVIDLKFNEAEYSKAEVHTENPEQEENLTDKLLRKMDESKRRRVEKFLDMLKRQGTPINPDDPRLQDIIDKL